MKPIKVLITTRDGSTKTLLADAEGFDIDLVLPFDEEISDWRVASQTLQSD